MEAKKNITDYIKVKEKIQLDENYFEDFTADFLAKIKSESEDINLISAENKASKDKKIIFLKPIFWISSIAASIIVIFGINYFLNYNAKLSEISESEILAYVEENSDDFTAEEIQSHIEESVEKKNFKEIDTTKSNIKKENLNEKTTQENLVPKASFNELLDSFSEEDLYLYLNSDEVELEDLEIL